MGKNELPFTIKGTPYISASLPQFCLFSQELHLCLLSFFPMDQQAVFSQPPPRSIIKKPSKFSRILRSIFGSCGRKSVEKTLVEDEKYGNTDYVSYFSSSGLDSDSAYSSEENGSKNGELQNEFQMVTDDIKQELQVADLKRELTETTEEKEAEKMISDLKMEAETLNGENSKLLQELVTECSQLREKLGERERELASHTEMHETHKSETSARMRGLELELDSLRTQKGDEVKLLMENVSAIEEDYGYFESRVYEIMNAFQGAKNRVRELEEQVDSLRNQNSKLEEQLRGKTHETETDQMPGVQEEEERKSYEDEDEDDDFEFPTPADKIIPVYPIFGRDELDGVPAGTYCVSGRVKQPVAGGGVTMAQERDRRRRLLMLRGKTHETETDQMPGVQEEEERKSYEDEDEDEDFEFPTPADEIIPVYPIFGRDERDGVPAGTYCVSGRVKQPVAGGGVTVAQERDRRRRLLMPYRQEGFFANVKMLSRNVKQIGKALKAINSKCIDKSQTNPESKNCRRDSSCGEKSVEKTLVEDEKDGNTDYFSYFSSSGLDSDSTYSSEEKGSKNGELQNEFQEVTDDIKQELQVADLKRELTETTEEKEAEKMISDLKMEAETLNGENSKLLKELVTEYSQLREKLGEREKELASHTEIHETHKSETSARMKGLELELDSLHTQKGEIEKHKADELSSLLKKLEEKEKEDEDEKDGNTDYSFSFSSSDLDSDSAYSSKEKGSKNGKLQNEFQKLTETTKEKEAEKMISDLKMEAETQLKEKLGKREMELASHTEIHETHKSETSARMRGLELKLDSLHTQKREKVKLLMENLSTIEDDYGYTESLVYEILNVGVRKKKIVDQRKMKDLEREVDSLRNQNSDLEEQLRSKNHKTDDFEFPTFADEIRPIFPIFGRNELDGVPASDASPAVAESPERCKKNNKKASETGRMNSTVAGEGVTVAPGRDRWRLLMLYKQEGFFANVKMLCTNVNAFKAVFIFIYLFLY
ncbi:unnamed protein product [Camellia sinensis]